MFVTIYALDLLYWKCAIGSTKMEFYRAVFMFLLCVLVSIFVRMLRTALLNVPNMFGRNLNRPFDNSIGFTESNAPSSLHQ